MSHRKEEDVSHLPKDQASSSFNVGSMNGLSSRKEPVRKKGPWAPDEDQILIDYITRHGEGNWNSIQKHSSLSRCGKSCRLRWTNHLMPNLKKGPFTTEEEQLVVELHAHFGNKWSHMTKYLPGRTDNEIKNYWNTRAKRLTRAGLSLYPSNMTFKLTNENQQNKSFAHVSDERKQDNMDFTTEFIIKDLNSYEGSISCLPPLPMGFSYEGLKSLNNLPLHHDANQLQGCGNTMKSLLENSIYNLPVIGQLSGHTYDNNSINPANNMGPQYDSDPRSCLATLDKTTQGSHALLNGISPSLRSQLGAATPEELPSFQYTDVKTSTLKCSTMSRCADNALPGGLFMKFACKHLGDCDIHKNLFSSMSSTMLEHPEKASTYPHTIVSDSFETIVDNPYTTVSGTYDELISPVEHSRASGICSPPKETSSTGSSDFAMNQETVVSFCQNIEKIPQKDFSNYFFGIDGSSACVIDDSFLEEQLAAIIYQDPPSFYDKQLCCDPSPVVTSASEIDSLTWESMPPVHEIPE